MRTGPGKHLKGLTLMGGVVKPEEVKVLFMLQGQLTDLELSLVRLFPRGRFTINGLMSTFSNIVTHIAHHSSRDYALRCSRLRRW
jgi:hypothetical protein